MAEGDAEDRTEAASARRLQRAAEQGDIPVSREAATISAFAAAAGVTAVLLSSHAGTAFAWFANALAGAGQPDPAFLHATMRSVVLAALPPALAAAAAAGAATALQTGFTLHAGALAPDLGRISPARGLKRVLSAETLIQAGKAALRLVLLAVILFLALRPVLLALPGLPRRPAPALAAVMAPALKHLVLWLGGAQIAFALADIAWVRFRHAAKLRMTRQELRQEQKETEGDPLIRQRLRQLRATRARRRMMAQVRRATVVVTNPTHFAVALAYSRGAAGAPRLIAKGADEVAARIREEAHNHRVPIVANPPLARALFRLELETEIPPEHFKAVAEIVAYVWRLSARRPVF